MNARKLLAATALGLVMALATTAARADCKALPLASEEVFGGVIKQRINLSLILRSENGAGLPDALSPKADYPHLIADLFFEPELIRELHDQPGRKRLGEGGAGDRALQDQPLVAGDFETVAQRAERLSQLRRQRCAERIPWSGRRRGGDLNGGFPRTPLLIRSCNADGGYDNR